MLTVFGKMNQNKHGENNPCHFSPTSFMCAYHHIFPLHCLKYFVIFLLNCWSSARSVWRNTWHNDLDVGRTILAKISYNLTICGFRRRFQPIYYSAHDSTAEGAALWEFSGWDAEAGWPGGKSHWARQIYGGRESRGHLSSGRPKWEEVQQLSFRVGVTWWRRWLDSNHHQVQSVRAV